MNITRTLLVSALAFQAAAFGADAGLLGLVMPGAKAIAGVEVARARVSPFGQFVLSHMQPDDPSFLQFVSGTGFDPGRDLTEIVMASSATADVKEHFLIAARGSFDPVKIAAAARLNGGAVSSFMGITVVSGGSAAPSTAAHSVIAFPNDSTALMGDTESVQGAIQRFLNKSLPSFTGSTFVPQVQTLSAVNDFWFLTLVPLSEFSGVMPNPQMGQAMNGNLFQAINQASGGVKFGANVKLGMQAVARSDKDAQALADVVRFIAGLIQTNKEKSPVAGQVSTLLDTVTISANGNTMSLSLTAPEAMLEQLFNSASQHTAKRARRQAAEPAIQ